MNKRMFGIIFASDQEEKLDNLTLVRATASVPFGGRYRIVDFTLSNFVNSNISSIGIITRQNYASLMDHIRMGRDWDLNRKNGGITIFPPYASTTSRFVFKDKIEAIYGITDFIIDKVKEDYVVIASSNVVSSIDFQAVLEEHIANNADITILTYKACPSNTKNLVLKTKNNKVIEAKITREASDKTAEIGINSYIIKKDLLLSLVKDNYEKGQMNLEKNIIQDNVSTLNIYTHPVVEHCAVINDILSYYNENMAILDKDKRESLFNGKGGKIYTRVKDSSPTRYRDGAVIKNSLIADGCDINGIVENSILFRGVTVESGAVVKNSIVMEGGIVKKNASIDYVISDKDVVINEKTALKGASNNPIVISKGKIV